METNSLLDGCERCPTCLLVPELLREEKNWWLFCEKDGHRAAGDSIEQAIKHWNIYVNFVRKVA